MIKDIKYNGFSETPSDYVCPDGDLATAIGMVHEDESLHPVQPPIHWFTMPDGYSVEYIHRNTGYIHYIVRHDKSFYWMNEHPKGVILTPADFSDDNKLIDLTCDSCSVNAIGNTLVIFADDGAHYFLWKPGESVYKSLGTHLPEIDLSFGLQGTINKGGESHYSGAAEPFNEEFGDDDGPEVLIDKPTYTSESFIDWITGKLMADVNKRIAEAHTKGKFVFPFLVRYAYRLYDQTLSMHSAPILMVPDSYCQPHCYIVGSSADYDEEVDKYFNVRIGTLECDLDYELKKNVVNTLQEWADIVMSVDVFISAPIWTFDQSAKVVGQSWKEFNERGYSISKTDAAGDSRYRLFYTSQHLIDEYGGYLVGGSGSNKRSDLYGKIELDLKRFSDIDIKEKILSCQNFYLLKSISINELEYLQRKKIEVRENYLPSLVNREVMSDDYDSHAQLIPRYSFAYNSRLTLANISKMLPYAPVPCSAFCFSEDSVIGDSGKATYRAYVYLKVDGKEIVVEDNSIVSQLAAGNSILYYYYPDPNAYKLVVRRDYYGSVTYQSYDLKQHDFLNGSVFFDGWTPTPGSATVPTVSEDITIELPNKMYTSEVGNPFVFLSAGVNTIGVSNIIGIRPAVKAMSPSQFGQFKFYVFAGDGVWALEVSSTGYLQLPQLVTPDIVLSGGESITQIDGHVLFASARGIMMLTGSTCACISDILNSNTPFLPFATEASNDLLPGLRSVCGDSLNVMTSIVPFRQFIQDCQMLYDYTHQRIIVYSPTHSYAYVYSIKSKNWTMLPSDIKGTINFYPNALAVTDEDKVVNYSEDNYAILTSVKGTIVTRPFKLDNGDILKTIDTVIQRGQFRRGHVKSILYGSRDLFNWQLVWSSQDHYLRGFRGTPYKYFRLALLCDLENDESLFGCTIGYEQRQTGRLR